MRGIVSICIIAIALLVGIFSLPAKTSMSPTSAPSTATSTAQLGWHRVVRVIDGDTIAMEMNGKNVTVRLIGLDTPETVDPRRPVQCFGIEASAKAKELLTGQTVRLESDPSQGEHDKYGRLLAYVYLADGTLFNQLMIREGYGHEYTYNLPYRYQKEFKEAQVLARAQKRGLWAEGACERLP